MENPFSSLVYYTIHTDNYNRMWVLPDLARALSMGILTLSRMSLHSSMCSSLRSRINDKLGEKRVDSGKLSMKKTFVNWWKNAISWTKNTKYIHASRIYFAIRHAYIHDMHGNNIATNQISLLTERHTTHEKGLPLNFASEVSVVSEAVQTDGHGLGDGAHALLKSLTLCCQSHGLPRTCEGVDVVAFFKLGRKVSHKPFVKQPPTDGRIKVF